MQQIVGRLKEVYAGFIDVDDLNKEKDKDFDDKLVSSVWLPLL